MAANTDRASLFLAKYLAGLDESELEKRLAAKPELPYQRIPRNHKLTDEAVQARWDVLDIDEASQQQILDPQTKDQMQVYKKNIENF